MRFFELLTGPGRGQGQAPLDSSLPAYYRILALLEGGLSKRRGEIVKGTPDELSDRLFDLLVKAGLAKI